MRLIDRLQKYLDSKSITAYAFEKTCDIANGYLGKQARGKGTVGSDILEKICEQYPDLNILWLLTGKGKMIVRPTTAPADDYQNLLREEQAVYEAKQKLVALLKQQLETLEDTPTPTKKKTSKK